MTMLGELGHFDNLLVVAAVGDVDEGGHNFKGYKLGSSLTKLNQSPK